MGTLSDDTCLALLSVKCPQVDCPVRLASTTSATCVENALQSLAPTDERILLLQLAESQIKRVLGRSEAAYTEETDHSVDSEVRVGSSAQWMPISSESTKTTRSVLTYMRHLDGKREHFVVWKIQKLKPMYENSQWCAVQWMRQRNDYVQLFLETDRCSQRNLIVHLRDIHPKLDGYHCVKQIERDGHLIGFSVQSRILSNNKSTPSPNGQVAFVAQVLRDCSLFEIKAINEEEAKQYTVPETERWSEVSDYSDSEEEEEVEIRKKDTRHSSGLLRPIPEAAKSESLAVICQQQFPQSSSVARGSCTETLFSHQLRTATAPSESRSTPLSMEQSRQTDFMSVHDTRAYLESYLEEDRHGFKRCVLETVLSSASCKDFLRQLVKKCGADNFRESLFTVRPHSLGNDGFDTVTSEAATELYWDQSHDTNQHNFGKVPGGEKGTKPYRRLHKYQLEAVERIMPEGNYLVVSATNTGKTWIFLEVARRLLMDDPGSRIYVVVPKVTLTAQHMKSFIAWGFPDDGFNVIALSSASNTSVEKVLQTSICVITADKLLRHLERGEITFSDISLLILDEAHNVKGRSGYKGIMNIYHYLSDADRGRTKIIGMTATPAQGKTQEKVLTSLGELLSSLHVPDANVINIPESNEEIRALIPQAVEESVEVEVRPCDKHFRRFFILSIGSILVDFLPTHLSALDLSEINGVAAPKYFDLNYGEDCTSVFRQWRYNVTSKVRASTAEAWHKIDIEQALLLVCFMEEAVQQSRDSGYETALHQFQESLKEKQRELESVIKQCQETPQRSLFKKIVNVIEDSAYIKLLPPSSAVGGTSPALIECGTFPKFEKLLEVLERYKEEEDFHAMVFVRTRSGAEQICALLKKSTLQKFMQFNFIVGRRASRTKDPACIYSEEAMLGVESWGKPEQRLAWFRGEGNRVLVTTNVCEEGIDVPSCELVVRYNSAATGKEYVQSKGRARKANARFVSLIEKGSKDSDYLRRCINETKWSSEALAKRPGTHHILWGCRF